MYDDFISISLNFLILLRYIGIRYEDLDELFFGTKLNDSIYNQALKIITSILNKMSCFRSVSRNTLSILKFLIFSMSLIIQKL